MRRFKNKRNYNAPWSPSGREEKKSEKKDSAGIAKERIIPVPNWGLAEKGKRKGSGKPGGLST